MRLKYGAKRARLFGVKMVVFLSFTFVAIISVLYLVNITMIDENDILRLTRHQVIYLACMLIFIGSSAGSLSVMFFRRETFSSYLFDKSIEELSVAAAQIEKIKKARIEDKEKTLELELLREKKKEEKFNRKKENK